MQTGQLSNQIIYSLGREINTSEQTVFIEFMRTHRISQDQFDILVKSDFSCSKVHVSNDEILKLEGCDEGGCNDIELKSAISPGEIVALEIKNIAYLTRSPTMTKSYLGGDAIDDFEMPKFDVLQAPFQYITNLNAEELGLTWMPFEQLNICYPLFSGIHDVLFFDYTNPLQPKLINREVYVDHVYGKFTSSMKHVFEKHYLSSISILDLNEDQDLFVDFWYEAITGVPFWIQAPNIPTCPKSGKSMKFVAQLATYDKVKAKDSTMVSRKTYFEEDASAMNFWGGGSMYIFMDPMSKTVGILIQST